MRHRFKNGYIAKKEKNSERFWLASSARLSSAAVFVLILSFFLTGCSIMKCRHAAGPSETVELAETMPAQIDDPLERFGVEITGIHMTAAGQMVDFRYRVLDAVKATPIFDRNTKAFLVHQATQKTLEVPTTAKVGPLRTTGTPEAGKVYWMFFGNPGIVKSGDRVNIEIGEFKINDLVVQ
jgi:hypothetical protein